MKDETESSHFQNRATVTEQQLLPLSRHRGQNRQRSRLDVREHQHLRAATEVLECRSKQELITRPGPEQPCITRCIRRETHVLIWANKKEHSVCSQQHKQSQANT